jgi:hypothetical protein
MFGGLSRAPSAIDNIPTNGYVVFPNSEDNGNWYSKDWQGNVKPIGSLNPVIGSQRVFKRKTTQQNSTSTAFTEYDSISVNNTQSVTVKHEVICDFKWGYASANQDIRVRLLLNGVQQGDEHRVEPKDPGTDQRIPGFFFDELDLPPGNNTISIEFASSQNGTQARMYSSKLRSMRIE